jgi:hypothetical protein
VCLQAAQPGLVVALQARPPGRQQHLALLDATSLAMVRTCLEDLPDLGAWSASPALAAVAFVRRNTSSLHFLDLGTGQVRPFPSSLPSREWQEPLLTPDGRFLFAWDRRAGDLQRFDLGGPEPHAGAAYVPPGAMANLRVSPDGQVLTGTVRGQVAFVALLSTQPRVPVVAVPPTASTGAVGEAPVVADPAARHFYTWRATYQLCVLDGTGSELSAHLIPGTQPTRALYLDPRGHRLLLQTESSLYAVELSGGFVNPAPARR